MENKTYYQRKLPHIQPEEGTFFITYRLFGSIPKPVIRSIHDNYKIQLFQLEKEFPTVKNKHESQISNDFEKKLRRIFKKKKYDLGKMSFKDYDGLFGC